jgi:hypothetical protein
MTDDTKKPHRRRPVPIPEAGSDVRPDGRKPRRLTIEELVAGMTRDNEPLWEDDWPVGDEII